MATTNALLTAEEFARISPAEGPMELVRGQVVMMNMPNYRHGAVCSRVARVLGNFVEDNGLGTVISNDSGIVTRRNPDSVRGADVAFYSYARMPKGVEPQSYAPQLPELVLEVKSPSDTWKDILTKTAEYLQAGVTNVCVVDPDNETVTIYYANQHDVKLEGDAVFTLPDLLPNFAVPIARFFHAQ